MSASVVLASLRGSTYRSVRLTSSLAAALLDGYFEHPVAMPRSALSMFIQSITPLRRPCLMHAGRT